MARLLRPLAGNRMTSISRAVKSGLGLTTWPWGRVVNLHRALNTLLHADIRAATGLDGTEFEFLLRLARFPGPRTHASMVAARMGYSAAGPTKLVARLEDKGVIRRERDRRTAARSGSR
jgi:predicted transcriptional regulator